MKYQYDKRLKRVVAMDGDNIVSVCDPDATSENIREMCRDRTPPGTRGTEKAFMEGHIGKFYHHGVRQWVGSADEVIDICKRDGLHAEGLRNFTAPEAPPQYGVRLDEDIVQECIQEELAANPDKGKNLRELREEVIEKHGQKPKVIHNTVIE